MPRESKLSLACYSSHSPNLCALAPLMKIPIRGKNPPVLRPAPFGKGGHWGIFRRCSERGAAHFHLLCCADRYISYFAGDIPIPYAYFAFFAVNSPNPRNQKGVP